MGRRCRRPRDAQIDRQLHRCKRRHVAVRCRRLALVGRVGRVHGRHAPRRRPAQIDRQRLPQPAQPAAHAARPNLGFPGRRTRPARSPRTDRPPSARTTRRSRASRLRSLQSVQAARRLSRSHRVRYVRPFELLCRRTQRSDVFRPARRRAAQVGADGPLYDSRIPMCAARAAALVHGGRSVAVRSRIAAGRAREHLRRTAAARQRARKRRTRGP